RGEHPNLIILMVFQVSSTEFDRFDGDQAEKEKNTIKRGGLLFTFIRAYRLIKLYHHTVVRVSTLRWQSPISLKAPIKRGYTGQRSNPPFQLAHVDCCACCLPWVGLI